MDTDLFGFIVLLLSASVLISSIIIAYFFLKEPRYNNSMIKDDQDLFNALEVIAKTEVPTIRTLTETGADRLDFHEVYVRTLHDMLKKAFDLGFKHRDDGGFN